MRNLTFGQKSIGILFLIFLIGLTLQYLRLGGFIVPSDNWQSIARITVIFITLTTFIIIFFVDSIQDQHTKRRNNILINVNKYIAMAITPIIFFFMASHFVNELIPTTYTNVTGTPYRSYVSIRNKGDLSQNCYRHEHSYKAVRSPQFEGNSYLNRLCISNDEFKIITYPAIMLVEGKEGFMGRTISDYVILPSEATIQNYQNYADEARNFWGKPVNPKNFKQKPEWPPSEDMRPKFEVKKSYH